MKITKKHITIILSCLIIVAVVIPYSMHLYQMNKTEFYVDETKAYSFPIPKGTKHDWKGLGMEAFRTKKSPQEIISFYDEYVSGLPKIDLEFEQSGYYDQSRSIVILKYEASESGNDTFFTVVYEEYRK